MVEYRPVPDADLAAFRRVLDYAFRAEAGPDVDHGDDPPFIGGRRALYEDDTLISTAVRLPLEVTVRGEWRAANGISGVATLPEHRRQGFVRRMLRESLAESRNDDVPFSLLWPFKHPFYRQFGWGRLGTHGRYELDPGDLSPVADHRLAGGTFHRLETDDTRALQAVDARFATRTDLAMRRTEAWYEYRVFDGWQSTPFVYGWRDDGDLRGYLVYTVEEDDGDRVLQVTDFGAPDDDAAVNLLRFLYRHDDQADQLRIFARADAQLFDLVEDPRSVELTVRPGPMGRLVDVAASLEALPAPDDVDASFTLEVDDGLCVWNDDTFAVELSDGQFTVEPGRRADPIASLSIETLSRLAFGSITPDRASVASDLEGDRGAVEALARAFPPRDCYLREFF